MRSCLRRFRLLYYGESVADDQKDKSSPGACEARKKRSIQELRCQRLIHLVEHVVHPLAEQLVHPAHAALAVERGQIEGASVEVEGHDDMVADYVVPGRFGGT